MRAFLMDQSAQHKRATIDDVVRLSGVSRSSVFRYLSGKTLRPTLSTAIETAMRRLGYPIAGRSDAQAFDLSISTSPSFGSFRGYAEVVEGIIARAVERGVHVSLGHGLGYEDIKGNPPVFPAERRGVVILGKSMTEEEVEAKELTAQGLPFLLVNRIMDEPGYSFVSADFRAAAMDATRHLLGLGRKRVAMWDDGSELSRVQRDKRRGFFSAFKAEGLEPVAELITGRDAGDIEAEAARLLSLAEPPDAWFAMDDRAAMRVIRKAHDLGFRVPEDLAVIGMNDTETASLSRPSVSSVRIPFFEAGWSAVDILGRLIERPVERSIRIILGHRLVARESSLGQTRKA
ncbi:MAG: LacI family DNA-binding transcriptional regulator [Spirochaetes bacterium]|nr:LacI family DNA-binding transcriptional regulator [Spirochaetota bacterium]